MKRLLLALLVLLLQDALYAQKQDNIWYFGQQAGLDFNSGGPVALTNSAMFAIEGCATMSDAAGKLLFYTNGDTVWNKNHQIMVNGIGLGGCLSSTQSVVIVPWPANPNKYYLFTTDCMEFIGKGGLRYSTIDISTNGGLGSVISKANMLNGPITEKLLAARDARTNTVWVIAHELESENFISYKVTNSGVSTSPVINKIGKIYSDTVGSTGQIKISPDGTRLVSTAFMKKPLIDLFKFDHATGKLSDWIQIDIPGANCYGVEFSPDNHKLYCANLSSPGNIYQFDIAGKWDNSVINSSIKNIGSFNSRYVGGLQLAPDNKIYVASIIIDPPDQPQPYLGTINAPNTSGVNCNYVVDAIHLKGKTSWYGLPQIMRSSFQAASTVESSEEILPIQVYPNPCSSEATFRIDEKHSGSKAMTIFNSKGMVVFNEMFSGSTIRFSRGNLPGGVYFLQLTRDGITIARGKFSIID